MDVHVFVVLVGPTLCFLLSGGLYFYCFSYQNPVMIWKANKSIQSRSFVMVLK